MEKRKNRGRVELMCNAKQDGVINQIGIPKNLKVTGGDGRANASWDEVEGAD